MDDSCMVNLRVEKGNLNSSLRRIQHLVDRIFCEPINVGKVFGSSRLDSLCQEVGRLNLLRLKKEKHSLKRENITVYIASKPQASGGHTAALIDVIRLSPPSRSIVIVTNTCGRTNRTAVEQRFRALPDVEVEYVPRGDHLSKLTWLQQRLIELAPDTVWLFNHHQDSVAIAAVQPDMGYRVSFYHHGDDRLCLGVYLSYAEHFDPLPFAFHNCRNVLGIMGNRYLPLVSPDQGERPRNLGHIKQPGLITCTAGGFNKVEVDYFIRYVDVVPEILHVTGGRHIHIGRLTPLALWRIRNGLRKLGITPDSFVHIPYVPSVWRTLHEYGVDVYVASFPYGGGRTLVEVMGAGVPAAIHSHCTSRMFGGFDMAYEGALVWRDPEELYAFLRSADRQSLDHQGKLARRWYETYHRDEIVRDALGQAGRSLDAPRLRPGFLPDAFMQAWQTSCEVTLGGVLNRVIWRNYRRWQALLGRLF